MRHRRPTCPRRERAQALADSPTIFARFETPVRCSWSSDQVDRTSEHPGHVAKSASHRRDGPGPRQGPVRHLTPSLPVPRAYGRPRPTRRHHLVTQAGGCEDDTAILGIGDTSSLSTRP